MVKVNFNVFHSIVSVSEQIEILRMCSMYLCHSKKYKDKKISLKLKLLKEFGSMDISLTVLLEFKDRMDSST